MRMRRVMRPARHALIPSDHACSKCKPDMVDDCRVLDTRRCSVHHSTRMRAHRMADPISSLTLCQTAIRRNFVRHQYPNLGILGLGTAY